MIDAVLVRLQWKSAARWPCQRSLINFSKQSAWTHILQGLRRLYPDAEEVVGDEDRLGEDRDDDRRCPLAEDVNGLSRVKRGRRKGGSAHEPVQD